MDKKATKKRIKEIEREVGKIARISAFMTSEQLAPYEKLVEEYGKLNELLINFEKELEQVMTNDLDSLAYVSHDLDIVSEDGTVVDRVYTNDDYDLGYPTESARWEVTYPSLEAALDRVGATRYGYLGTRVEVFINGEIYPETEKSLFRTKEHV